MLCFFKRVKIIIMKGLKVFVDNLANRINQPHYLEIELRKVFFAGVKFCQEKNNWISTKIALPELLPNENYSKNVLAFCNGQLMIMCYCYNPSEDDSENGFFWANCNGQIDGDAEFDDEYDVKFWQPLPSVEGLSA